MCFLVGNSKPATILSISAHRTRQVWFSLTFKNGVRVIKKAGDLHDKLIEEIKDLPAFRTATDFSTQCVFQPIPTLFAKHSVQRGGNVLGLDKVKENALLWLLVGSTDTVEQDNIMRKKLTILSSTMKQFARPHQLLVDWKYLNYVDGTQDPLKSHGKENVELIRKVATKYDPPGMFQKKVVSGWKISKVEV